MGLFIDKLANFDKLVYSFKKHIKLINRQIFYFFSLLKSM